MLWLERRVVDSLVHELDDERRAAVIAYVDSALKVMADPIGTGVAAE